MRSQRRPSQCSASVWSPFPPQPPGTLSHEPTAHTSSRRLAEIENRMSLMTPPAERTLGLGMIVQARPFQCSISVRVTGERTPPE